MTSTTTEAREDGNVGSVDTALRLMRILGARRSVRVTDAGDELGVSRSTAHRLLRVLLRHGFAAQDPVTKAYEIGPSWRLFGSFALSPWLADSARPAIAELVASFGETVQLLMLQPEGSVRCVLAVEGDRLIRAAAREGARFPAHLTAGGRVLLGLLPEPQRSDMTARSQALADTLAGPRVTDVPPTASVEPEPPRSWCVQHDLLEPGTSAVSTAVVRPDVTFSIDVVLPTARLTADLEKTLLRDLRRIAGSLAVATEPSLAGRIG
jgi:DNA-binding IclR family transcriptional regulator